MPVIEPPDPNDCAWLQTAAPSGMSWGQYLRNAPIFSSQRGILGGPWAECIAWGVIYEHSNDFESDPRYCADGVIGPVLEALAQRSGGNQDIMDAADKLEAMCHELADNGQPLPAIQQAVTVPNNAVPGQPMKVPNPQMPGTYQTVMCPPDAQPGQTIQTSAPIQPKKGGMSTGTKVAFAAGGVAAVGVAAGVAYYATVGGGFDGFQGDVSDLAANAADFGGEAADWAGDAGGDAAEWAGDAGGAMFEWGGDACEDAGDFITDMF